MNDIKYISIIFIFSTSLVISCNQKDSLKINGTIGNKFNLAGTQNYTLKEQEELLLFIKDQIKLGETLDEYFKYKNNNEIQKAKYLLESEGLSEVPRIELNSAYLLIKMYQHDMLFKPLIRCNKYESYLISITEEQLHELEPYVNKQIELELHINKIGYMERHKTKLYRLIGFEKFAK